MPVVWIYGPISLDDGIWLLVRSLGSSGSPPIFFFIVVDDFFIFLASIYTCCPDLCCSHFAQREFDVCLALLRELLSRDPSDPVLLSRLAYVLLQIGDLVAAHAAFARIEGLGDRNPGVEFENLVGRNRALGFIVAKDWAAAVREYEACVERDPADAVAINNKALCLMYSRDLSDSIKVLEGALERVPTVAVNETLIVNLCSMYELAYVHHGEVKKSLSNWIARVAPDDFNPSCMRI